MSAEFFGTGQQKAILARGADLFAVLSDDPRFSYYGRNVGLAVMQPDDIPTLAALTRLQGASSCANLPHSDLSELRRAATDQGLSTTQYRRWSGGADALTAARALRHDTPLPADLTLHRINADSPPESLAKLAQVALACGVLPIAGTVLRGITRPGTSFVAIDAQGHPVACAAAAAYLHPDSDGGECWWGMLATDPARRGQRLALRLGAEALIDITTRFSFARVFTGVEPGNTASERVCTRLGLVPEDRSVISTVDPAQLAGGRVSR